VGALCVVVLVPHGRTHRVVVRLRKALIDGGMSRSILIIEYDDCEGGDKQLAMS
jgi:hypothetical protein